ncbi:MAG: AAA family ATPase [Acidimicrobiia bacterium]
MFLKALTLRGFKSFADKTVLDFEPGVTVVVGPNGSGKSNLVDAVAWVLGAQGPRTLRGAKMDDVVFAGTPQRPALGRAEVSLTIDNTSGLLPIEFSEVTITRTLFRAGDSEYRINDAPCRLLDIQELLSDTGIGRQQHVIVGQGQLDAVLNSRPEDRRAIIEEAAGILKFRKRRERSERRLEATEGSLLRLNDLLREVRRQLTPLQKQADAARRHDGVVDELRGIRLHLVGHEIAGLQARIERLRDQSAEQARLDAEHRERLRVLDLAVLDAEHALGAMSEDSSADWLVRVEALRERARGLQALVAEKLRGIDRELAAAADEGVVETLVAEADSLRAELGEVEGMLADGGAPGPEVVARHETALREADAGWRAAEADAARWRARADALDLGLGAARAAAGAMHVADIDGVAGPLVDLLEVEAGAEAAVAAALGEAMRAVVVQGGDAAAEAVARLRDGEATGLLLVVDALTPPGQPRLSPPGTRPLADCVRAQLPGLQHALSRLLAGIVLVDAGWRTAMELALAEPDLVVVTREGDRLGGGAPWRIGGAGDEAVTQAAFEEAMSRASDADAARVIAEEAVQTARADLDVARSAAARHVEAEHRRTMLHERLAAVETRLAARDGDAQARAEAQRHALHSRATAYRDVAARLDEYGTRAAVLHARLSDRRRRQSESARASAHQLEGLRAERGQLERALLEVRERTQRAEIESAESRLRLETAVERLRTDYDVEPAAALDAPAPEVPAGTTLAGRARDLERDLRLMGPINPLALEEHDALQERHAFLQEQLEDVKASRRELMRVIRAVDQEIVSVFEQAFADVAEHFTALFATLFPGGGGKLSLTDPGDMLNTGIEMEARPSGKNVRRLSLLSGGERSLTALAFLFAVFRARPSPFYLMDEVEAALDDVNLHRFLDLVHEFRNEAQLLIVSHQKRTMEAADCLYGVSMPPGGSSRVVSQRVRDEIGV